MGGTSLMHRFKVRTIVKAIRKNGLPKVKGQYLTYDDHRDSWAGTPSGGCAIGQGAYNLGVSAQTLYGSLPGYLGARIVNLNDSTNMTLAEIADEIEKEYPHIMDDRITIR
jgi:hypothetical protein